MKRICLFAGYDKNNIIHDYVVYYLKELSSVSDVYYMADNEISDEENGKILPYVNGGGYTALTIRNMTLAHGRN